ncbi:TonB-dependent receptor plug domain-containing protein [Flavobacterium sp. F372]|uniref:TonB-dependent receptor n=1 Tax=Flavobacterium bernardetii TaxID=2813823 RepID=A0ABR7J201_9FLAO|nr:TonB-dependent receptor [Flavobacterium bernardetii]MBC5836106.1 TonB-dependent receptor [Flavobacterium bernardetii]NHF71291.1 TonB-dependent receptor plug domain-containing protein [Flavobacterium bernardetii]
MSLSLKSIRFILFFVLISSFSFAQKARIKGIVLNENNEPIENVSVSSPTSNTVTNSNGFYILEIDANSEITIIYSSETLKKSTYKVKLKPNEDFEWNPILGTITETIETVVISGKNRKINGATAVSPVIIRRIPGANAGVENLIKTLPGVYSNNELSTSYAVRGGNYDENLVYVNEIEVYRPFLVRSGQQEGLSFTNTDLVQNIDFYAGGFQAKYGDKLSSVLDIAYRTPKSFHAGLEASLLGGSIFAEGVSKNQKWSNITGVRYRNNSLLVKSQETETNYKPSFLDVQSLFNFNLNTKWNFSFLGNIAQNNYNYQPTTRQTNFGTISEPIALLIQYEGQEKDKYTTFFGAIKSVYEPNKNNKYKYISSAYHTVEEEYYDILAQYRLGEVDANIGSETFGDVVFSRGIGSQLNHARNNLDALIVTNELKGNHKLNDNNAVEWSFKHNFENIRDRVVEWEVIDSAGFSLPNPLLEYVNDQPYNPYYGPLAPYQNVRAKNNTTINRLSAYLNWNHEGRLGEHTYYVNAGVRGQSWIVSNNGISGDNQFTFSPRAQFILKPKWEKEMIFRFSVGVYNQPPFYRELRANDGSVNPNVKDQKSIHFVLGHDYSFKMWERPFKLVSEAYYKTINDVNTYTIDNVRIRYRANNDATAYVYGIDGRLNGEFVPGVESWFTFGYLKTEENQNGRGNIARPTDQRLKFAILFQDYMPNIPSLKMYLNLVYNTGLPGGSPAYADAYDYQSRLNDYRRADAGFSYVFKDAKLGAHRKWLANFSEFSLGFEIYNMFNNQNSITNTWVRDVYTKTQYGVPNYLTTRTFNLKLSMRI